MEAKFGLLKKKRYKRLESIEMKFFRKTAGYTLFDHERIEDIFEKLEVEPVDKKLRRYKPNWLRHVTRMKRKKYEQKKIVQNYRPNGRR